MKEIKTLADLEAFAPWERDAWFAERFGYTDIGEDGWGNTTARHPDKLGQYGGLGEKRNLPDFSTTPQGIAELKAEMVKRGYRWQSRLEEEGSYYFAFLARTWIYSRYDTTEIEATWKAAALALLRE